MFEEIITDNDRISDNPGRNTKLFYLNPNYYCKTKNENRVGQETDDFITEISPSSDMSNSTLKDNAEQIDCNLSSDYDQYQINSDDINLDGYLSTQESLCTECRFGNGQISLFSSFNNTQCKTQSNCFPSMVDEIIDIGNENQYDDKRSLPKRSPPVSPKSKDSEIYMQQCSPSQNCLKKLKSEGRVSIVQDNTIQYKLIEPTTVTCESSIPNLADIIQMTESAVKVCDDTLVPEAKHTHHVNAGIKKIFPKRSGSPDDSTLHQINPEILQHTETIGNNTKENTAQEIAKILIVENISAANGTDYGSLNEIITTPCQDLDQIDSSYSYSTSSQSTIEEIYCIDAIDEIDYYSKNVEMTNEAPEPEILRTISSTFSASPIEEMYHIDAADDIGYLIIAKVVNEMPESQTEKNNNEVIQDKEIMSTTIISSGHDPLINVPPNKMDTIKKNPINLKSQEDLTSETAVTNTRAGDDFQSQLCLTETQLTKIETEDEITGKNILPVYPMDFPVTDVDSAKDSEFKRERVAKAPDDSSVLEISIESESEQSLKQDRIMEREKIRTVHVVDNSRTTSSNFRNVSQEYSKTGNVPVDLTIVNQICSHIENVIPSRDVSTKNVETTILPDDFDTQLPTNSQLDNIERQDKMAMKEMTSVNFTVGPVANVTSRRDLNASSGDSQAFKDDLGLEFLSESELQRIEEEAYITAKKETSVFHLKNVNAKSIPNEQNLFYRHERMNMITDDLVIPNWVTNPTPEPNYDKMKRAIHMRRENVKKMLQEILRLSTIVSKVRSIVHAERENSDTEATPNGNARIQESHTTPLMGKKSNHQSVKLEATGDTEINTYPGENAVTIDLKDSEIFYTPHSSGSKYIAPSNTVVAAAAATRTATINTNSVSKDGKESGKFYEPQSNRAKYDALSVFNRPIDVEFKRGNVSSSYMLSSASNIFGSLKRNFDGHRCCETDLSSTKCNGRESETGYQNKKRDSDGISKNKVKLRSGPKAEYQLSKISLNATSSVEDKKLFNTNKVVGQSDTIFYLPDKFSSASNNYTVLPSTKNSQSLSSLNFIERPSAYVKSDVENPLDIRRNLTPQTICNDDSIFYNGNKEKEMTFKML